MDVLLTHSYFLHLDAKELKAQMPYPPLGTLYAAQMLLNANVSAAVHDTMFEQTPNSIGEALLRHRPQIVVIYDDQFNFLTKMCLTRMREAAFHMTRIAKHFGCTVIVFSSDATDHLAEYFLHGVDYVILGEAEHTLVELCENLLPKGTAPLDSIRGVSYVQDGNIHRTPPRSIAQRVDDFPFPAWNLIDLGSYRRRWLKKHGYWSLNIVTTRGCPFHCNWCAKPIYGQVYNSRSPRNVVEEMLFLKETYHPDHIWFADDIFGLKPGWLQEFAAAVSAANAAIPYKCLSRVDLLLKDKAIVHLKNSGCKTVWVGAESGSQKILDAMDKGTSIAQIYEATKQLRAHGLRVGFFLQFGYPGETMQDIELTLKMVEECLPDEIGVSVSYPLPGTKFYERTREQLLHKANWTESNDLEMMFRGTFAPEFYKTLHTITHKKLRVWQARNAARRGWMQRETLSKKSVRFFASSAYHAATLPMLQSRLRGFKPREHS